MIDQLVMRCTFKKDHDYISGSNRYEWSSFNLRELKIPLEGKIEPDNSISELKHRWESLKSSMTGIGFKVFNSPTNHIKPEPYIELKASPAKVIQGHNIFGPLDLKECALAIIEVLFTTYPDVADHLDQSTWEVAEMHLTFFSRAPSEREAELFIGALQNISRGHTKSRHGYATTAYFGRKKTRLKALRIYCKHPEVVIPPKTNRPQK